LEKFILSFSFFVFLPSLLFLAVAPEADCLVALPDSADTRAEFVRFVAFVLQAAVAATRTREAAKVAALCGVLADPVDGRVCADVLAHGVDANDFKPLEDAVLVHPVAV